MSIANRNEVYEALRRRVLTLELEPGENIDETRISTEFGISRTPLRDILRQLSGEGYISIIENRGASVSAMNHKTLRDFRQTALLIYLAVAKLAVLNTTPQQIEALKEAQQKFVTAVRSDDVNSLVATNEEFHSIIGRMADNQFLWPSLRRLLIDHARIAQTVYQKKNTSISSRLEEAIIQHDGIIAAIETGDTETLIEITTQHWTLSMRESDLFQHPEPLRDESLFQISKRD